jgi:hypothetical protein
MTVTKRGKELRDDAPDSVISLIWAVLGDVNRVRALAYLVAVFSYIPIACICTTVIVIALAGTKGSTPHLLWPSGVVLSPLLTFLFIQVKKAISKRRGDARPVGSGTRKRSPALSRKQDRPVRKRKQ